MGGGVPFVDLGMSTASDPSTRAELGTRCAHAPVLGSINSPFGPRRSVQDRTVTRQHQGVDLAGRVGDPVFAAGAGVVEAATDNGARGFGCYGRVIVIAHPQWGDDRTLYAHLSEVMVRVGEHVRAGQRIGSVGATNGSEAHPGTTFADGACAAGGRLNPPSRASGPHLHFEAAPGRYPRTYDAPRHEPIGWLAARGVVYTGTRLVRTSSCMGADASRTGTSRVTSRTQTTPAGGLAFAGTLFGMGLALLSRWKGSPK